MQTNLNSTIDYVQPDFYRFNSDSLKLVELVFSKGRREHYDLVADFGSGCGILGIELSQKNLSFTKMDLIEYQSEFYSFMKENIALFGKGDIVPLIKNYYRVNKKYDLIVSNPPYFNPDHNRIGENEARNLCRFGNMADFLELIQKSLKPGGEAFVLASREEKFEIPFEKYEEISLHKKVSLFHFCLDEKTEQ